LKEAKAAALQLRSPPAEEAKTTNLKEQANMEIFLRITCHFKKNKARQ